MQITKIHRGEFVELRIVGRMDGYWSEHLTTGLAEVVREGGHHIRVNLADVSFLSSAGIRVLVQFFKQLRAIEGSLAVHGSLGVESAAGSRRIIGVGLSAAATAAGCAGPGFIERDRG